MAAGMLWIVCGLYWSCMAQRNKLYQTMFTSETLVHWINSLFVLVLVNLKQVKYSLYTSKRPNIYQIMDKVGRINRSSSHIKLFISEIQRADGSRAEWPNTPNHCGPWSTKGQNDPWDPKPLSKLMCPGGNFCEWVILKQDEGVAAPHVLEAEMQLLLWKVLVKLTFSLKSLQQLFDRLQLNFVQTLHLFFCNISISKRLIGTHSTYRRLSNK